MTTQPQRTSSRCRWSTARPMRPFCCALAVMLVCAGLALAGGGAANAQTSTTQVSNSGQAAGDSRSLADHDLTQSFRTGDNSAGYTLTGVSFYFTDVADASAQYDVSVYFLAPGSRNQMIATLTPPSSLVANSLNTWTTDGAYLPGDWLYYVVIDSDSPADNQVGHTDSDAEDDGASEGWSIGNFSDVRSRDDSANNWALRFNSLQIQVHGYARTSDTAAVPPAAPAAPTVTGTSYTTLDVSWTPPASTGTQITGYEVQYREGSSGSFVYWAGTGTILSTTITELVSDTSYEVQVRASNAAGTSDWSPSGTASTHLTEAGAPNYGSANVADQVFTQNVQVGLYLPIGQGGDPPLTYTLTGPNGEGLPAGLHFNPGPRVLYGWPTAAQEAKTYTYTATDYDNDSVSLTFTITVKPPDSAASFVIYHDPDAGAASVSRYNQATALLDNAGITYSVVSGDVYAYVLALTGLPKSIMPRFFLGDPIEEGWTSQTNVNNGGLRWLKTKAAELAP